MAVGQLTPVQIDTDVHSMTIVSTGRLCLAGGGARNDTGMASNDFYASFDAGRSWQRLDAEALGGIQGEIYVAHDRFFIAVSSNDNGSAWTSTDLLTWTRITRPLRVWLTRPTTAFLYAQGAYWVYNRKNYGYTGPGDLDPEHSDTVLRSVDGVNWTEVVLMPSSWGGLGEWMHFGMFTMNDRLYAVSTWNATYGQIVYGRIYDVTDDRLRIVAELENVYPQEIMVSNTAMLRFRSESGDVPAYFFNGSGWESPGNVPIGAYNFDDAGLYQGDTYTLLSLYGSIYRKENGGAWVVTAPAERPYDNYRTRPQRAVDGNLYAVFGGAPSYQNSYPTVVSTDQGRTWSNITDALGNFTSMCLTDAGVLISTNAGWITPGPSLFLYELAELNTDAPAFWQAFLVSYETAGSLVDTPPTSGGGDPGTGTPDPGTGTGTPGTGTGTAWYTDDFEQSSPLQGGWSFTSEWSSTGQYSLRTPRLTRDGSADFGLYVKMDEPGTLTLDYRMVNGFIRSNLNNVTQPEVSADGVKTGTYTLALPAGDCLISIAYWGGSFGTLPEGTEYRFAMDNLRITGKGTMVQVGSAGYQGAEEENTGGGDTGGGTNPDTGTGTSPSTPPSGAWYADDFEGASPMAGEWRYDTSWYSKGTRSLRSKAITHSQSTSVGFDFTMTTAGELSFDYKVSSENNFDWLTIYLDGVQFDHYSFELNGTAKIPVGVGNHSLQITYSKDGTGSSGADSAWIDNLVITGAGSITGYTSSQSGTGSGGDTTTPVDTSPPWYTDDFEGSSPMQGAWSFDTTWSSTGTQSLRSKTITHSQSTSVGVKFNMRREGTLSLDYKASSEPNFDFLQIQVDGTQPAQYSGETTGTFTRTLAAGDHTLLVTYLKDSSESANSDCAFIDNLRITGGGMITGYTADGVDVAGTVSPT